MTVQIAPLTQRAASKTLEAHHENIRDLPLRKLFAEEPQARRTHDGGGRRHLSGLFEESHHG